MGSLRREQGDSVPSNPWETWKTQGAGLEKGEERVFQVPFLCLPL